MVEAEGTLTAIDEWGKRRLAYLIDDLAEGYYVQMCIRDSPSAGQVWSWSCSRW